MNNNHGGTRTGSGRKKSPDLKHPITIYVTETFIKKAGGKENVRNVLYNFLEQ